MGMTHTIQLDNNSETIRIKRGAHKMYYKISVIYN